MEIAKWLWRLDLNINIHARNDELFIFACENGHLETAQWLWQLDQNIDIHTQNEIAFRFACRNGHLEIAKWLWQLGQNIDMHAKNDEAFRYSCLHDHIEIAQWLCTLCDYYYILICNNKIIKWLIKDENPMILELIENNKYNEAISKLKIKSESTKNKHECLVCYDEPINIIQLPCHHTLCLETIIRFHVINNSVMKKCFYCQKEYQWIECRSLENI